MIKSSITNPIIRCFVALVIVLGFFVATDSYAATLSVSPGTGVYPSGTTFTARVIVNTEGKPINAADATLSFNPNELSVVSVNRSSSIFNLWVTEPSFSNSAGTISFSGGSPSGYTGSAGQVMSITFRALGAGTARVSFKNGSVLANDGRGSNVLTSMNGGNFTLQTASVAPEPEIIEYIAPANTPAAPAITSKTHTDPSKWYQAANASLQWTVPAGVTEIRTLLDQNPTTVPTKVYETPINSITLEDLPEGVSYFHIQFRNADGWGRVTHYRLGVDSEKPSSFDISHGENADLTAPEQVLLLDAIDDTSGIAHYMVKIDDTKPYEYIDDTGSSTITLPKLDPGYHSVIIEAFDYAGNSLVSTYSFTIAAFDRPVFTEFPTSMGAEVIPVIKGVTRPNATVEVTLRKIGSEPSNYILVSDESGEFVFIPEGRLATGVYELSAIAVDVHGAKSERSDTIRIAVQEPGYIQIGSFIVSILSIIIPLLALLLLCIIGVLYFWRRIGYLRSSVRTESTEALDILHREFSALQTELRAQEAVLQESRKTKKLTKAESSMIETIDRALQKSQQAVEKEINDVTKLTNKKK